MRGTLHVLPWLLPGFVVSILLGAAASVRIGRILLTGRWVAWMLIASLGLVISATLTPLGGVLDLGTSAIGSCDLSRIGLAPLHDLLTIGDTSLNVVLFIPLGSAVGLVPGSRRKTLLVTLTVMLPFAIETIQLLLPALGRGCQSADVADNLTGLVIGILVGTGARILGGASGTMSE